jgi:hypothetical protein
VLERKGEGIPPAVFRRLVSLAIGLSLRVMQGKACLVLQLVKQERRAEVAEAATQLT